MYNYPFFSFPAFRNYGYYSHNNLASPSTNIMQSSEVPNANIRLNNFMPNNPRNNNYKRNTKAKKKSNTNANTSLIEQKHNEKNTSNAIFEIFGIKLYFDDILLISLIFFLYNEGVKDDYLFISLVLLLLS
jgi:hypothetical protein